ncbi:DMT family transporter [Psychrobacter aestuarii]|uniref:EamA domain-containing protein n=1 Tax=Psychrobacter aestuarii TaxID=556327 RepID=A0ABN0VJU1_9GAMM|nr:DMT family transporter [Psychrobacter aestuarii]
MSKRDLTIFFMLALLWSMSFVLYRVGVPEFGAVVFACLRMLFAGLTMVVFLLLNPASRQGIRAHYKMLTIIGVLSTAVPFMLFAFAAQSINAGVLAVLNASVPVMSGFIASMFFNEKLSKKQVMGLLIGIAGVAILMSDRLFAGASNNTDFMSSILPLGYALLGGAGRGTPSARI